MFASVTAFNRGLGIFLLVGIVMAMPMAPQSQAQEQRELERLVAEKELPPGAVCGSPSSDELRLTKSPTCDGREPAAELILCKHASTERLTLRRLECAADEKALRKGQVAALMGLLPVSRRFGPQVLTTPDGDDTIDAINKCGQAACLCTDGFCADLIDANYCSDFHCGGDQCICIF